MSSNKVSESPADRVPNKTQEQSWKYRCPLCEATYDNEILTKVHITRSEDTDHLNYDGFMPEIEVEILDDDGEVVETVSRRPEDIDTTSLTIDDFPSDKSEKHKHILLVAAFDPHEKTYTTIEEKVDRRFDNHNLDSLSYSSIRRVIRAFYRPQNEKQVKKDGHNEEENQFEKLTPKQQSIIIARLENPEQPTTKIADKVGCAPSYPPQVIEKTNSITKRLEERIENGEDVEKIIRDELDQESIEELVENELLRNVGVDVDEVTGYDRIDRNKMWGSPIEDSGLMTAGPPDVDNSNDENEKESIHINSEIGEENTEKNANSHRRSSGDGKEFNRAIPKKEVKELKKKVEFLRHTFDRASVPEDDDISAVAALAHQFEETCEEILEGT